MIDEHESGAGRPEVAAGLLIRDGAGRVLLVEPAYKQGWDLPGGHVEPGESPAQACRREVGEELGLDRSAGRLLVVDWAPVPDRGDKVIFVFDGGLLTDGDLAGLVLDPAEIARVRFWAVGAVAEITPDRLARRIGLAVAAMDLSRTVYAEHGREVRPTDQGKDGDDGEGDDSLRDRLDRAMAVVERDLACSRPEFLPLRLVEVSQRDTSDAEPVVRVVDRDGHYWGGVDSLWGGTDRAAVFTVAEAVQDHLAGMRGQLWPTCAVHGLGLHVRPAGAPRTWTLDDRIGASPAWWCSAGDGHDVALVGQLPATR